MNQFEFSTVNILLPEPPPASDRRMVSGHDLGLVERVLDALLADPTTNAAMMATGVAPAGRAEVNEEHIHRRYIKLSEVGDAPPPAGTPLFIEDIGVLVVPAPDQDPVGTVSRVLADLKPRVEVRAPVPQSAAGMRRSGVLTVPNERVAPPPLVARQEVWPEAALSLGMLAEALPWGVARVNAPRVWQAGHRGQGVRVAVVDSGVGPHIDLPEVVSGATFVPGTSSWRDGEGHGTHVAGTIAARWNGRGVVGVAPECELMAVRVLNNLGKGSDAWIGAGITWAANNGARVINLSLGGGYSDVIERACRYAAQTKNAVLCAAAGNNYCGSVIWPAASHHCIAVGALARGDRRCPLSACGRNLNVMAPGCGILSTVVGNGYESWDGTSMATPHCAGVVALVFNRYTGTPQQVKEHLQNTALGLGDWLYFGAGVIQADRAVLGGRGDSDLFLELPLNS